MYENIITIIDIISTCAFGVALLFAVRIPRSIMDQPSKTFLALSLGIYVFVGLSNILEHGQITDYLDRYEDYVEIFFPLFFLYFIYSVITRQELNNREQAEKALRKTLKEREELERIVNYSPAVVFLWRAAEGWPVEFVSDNVQQYGYSPEDFYSKRVDFASIVHPDDLERVAAEVARYSQEGRKDFVQEYRILTKGGEIRCIDDHTQVRHDSNDEITHYQGIVLDITERKQAEEALRESKNKLRNIVENSTNMFYSHTTDHILTYLSPQVHDILGYKPEEAMVKWTELASDNPINEEGFQRTEKAIKTGKAQAPYELELVHKSGKIVWAEIREAPIVENGKTISIVGALTDITERKRAESAIKESEEKYRTLIETANDAIFVADVETGIILDINKRAEELIGMPAEKIIGMHQSQLHPKEKAEQYRKIFKDHIQKGKAISGEDLFVCNKDGHKIPVAISASVTKIKGRKVIQGFFRDITERKQAEEEKKTLEDQLRQAQKMEAVGRLAGGIAHDFNNILTVIMGYSNIMQMKMSEDDPLQADVDQILGASHRAAQLTHSLLAFSRQQIIHPKPTKLNEIILKVEKLLSRLIGEDIEIRTMLADKDLTIMADSSQIEQVLMNLATNARDAMPEGGLLTISTELVELDKYFIKTYGYNVKPGMYSLISVTDSGSGMDEGTRKKIFEPFFTTKELGRGTGLGLAIIYGIVKQHNGFVDVFSKPGEGTTFKIYLPVIKSAIKETEADTLPPQKGGTETVLVAEDDETVREIIKTILDRFGYKVIEAVDGEDAVTLFKKNKIDLVILDVIMPKKNGKEAYDEMKDFCPEIKAIFTSGYTTEIIDKKGV
ncbi:MAG: PAS domain S-box protein, partial [Proteobacteria bacterium]|nr:PAS domain S-box protein [Pseudomonadota bacterium]